MLDLTKKIAEPLEEAGDAKETVWEHTKELSERLGGYSFPMNTSHGEYTSLEDMFEAEWQHLKGMADAYDIPIVAMEYPVMDFQKQHHVLSHNTVSVKTENIRVKCNNYKSPLDIYRLFDMFDEDVNELDMVLCVYALFAGQGCWSHRWGTYWQLGTLKTFSDIPRIR